MVRYHIYEQPGGTWIVKDDTCFNKRQVYRIAETGPNAPEPRDRQIFCGDTYILTVQIDRLQRLVKVIGVGIDQPIQFNWPQTRKGRCDLRVGNEAFQCNRSKLTCVRGGRRILIANWDRKFTSFNKVGYLDVYYAADPRIPDVMNTPMILATFIGVQQCMKLVDTAANQTPPLQIQPRFEFGGQNVERYVNAAVEIWRLVRRFYRGP